MEGERDGGREGGRKGGREVFSISHATTSIKHTFGTARPSARVALVLM